jgi:hypothetical protein
MSRVAVPVIALVGALLVVAGAVYAATNSTSEGAAGAVLVIAAGAILLLGAATAFLLGRRRRDA